MSYNFSCKEYYENGIHVGFEVNFNFQQLTVKIDEVSGVLLDTGLQTINPYAFYGLNADILERLTQNYTASKDSMFAVAPQPKQIKWYRNKVKRYWCKAIHNEWLKIMSKIDSHKLDIARALFAANFKSGMSAGTALLTNLSQVSQEHRKDILSFVPAAMLADRSLGLRLFCGPRAMPDDSYIVAEIHDADHCDSLDKICTGDEDWRGWFCHPYYSSIPSELTETLASVVPGIAFSSLDKLNSICLPRPLKSKCEIIVACQSPVCNHKTALLNSDRDSILTSVKILNSTTHHNLNSRKTSDLVFLTDSSDRSKKKGVKNIQKLTEDVVESKYDVKLIKATRRQIKWDAPNLFNEKSEIPF